MIVFMKYLGLTFFLFTMACATRPVNPDLNLISEGEYFRVIDRNTQSTKVYDGFMNTMDLAAVMKTTAVQNAQADQNARIYQWSTEQYQAEKAKIPAAVAKESEFFLSFFVPERKHDDLQKPGTKWRVFLDAGGRRYDATIVRKKALLIELQSLYPSHTRWHTAYQVTFPIPMTQLEKIPSKLTFTGPVGSASLDFTPVE